MSISSNFQKLLFQQILTIFYNIMTTEKYPQLEQIYRGLTTFSQQARNSKSIKHNYLWSEICTLKNIHKKLKDCFKQIPKIVQETKDIDNEDKRIKFITTMIEKSKKKELRIIDNVKNMDEKLNLLVSQLRNLKEELQRLHKKNKKMKEKLFIMEAMQYRKQFTVKANDQFKDTIKQVNKRLQEKRVKRKSYSAESIYKHNSKINKVNSIIDEFNAIWVDCQYNSSQQKFLKKFNSNKKVKDEDKKIIFYKQKFIIDDINTSKLLLQDSKQSLISKFINENSQTADSLLMQKFEQLSKAKQYFRMIPSQAVLQLVFYHDKMPQLRNLIQSEKKQIYLRKKSTHKNNLKIIGITKNKPLKL